jgi:hypothetical protein
MQIVLGKQRQQSGGREDLGAKRLLARFPFRQSLVRPRHEMRVDIRNIGIAGIRGGNLGLRQQARGKGGDKQTRHGLTVITNRNGPARREGPLAPGTPGVRIEECA